jgi:tRNA-specific 2-thiouridylase
MKVAVAMSGGVDSSVTAAIIKRAGHDIIGLTMLLTDGDNSRKAIADARKVAGILGIPHQVVDLRDIFSRIVIADFCEEYRSGRTPNPCVLCNRHIKFGALWEEAHGSSADFLATGHYARIEKDKKGRYALKKGRDRRKDQSYFLFRLTQQQLSHSLFPLGDLTKIEVKKMAREMGLPVANRPESQEICFVTDNDHTAFLKDHIKGQIKSGPILDQEGKVVGRHNGIMFYTVGQRKGLGITSSKPAYVTAIDVARNAVIVGTKEQTCTGELMADNLNWIAGSRPVKPVKLKARIRYRHPAAAAVVSPLDETRARVIFNEPQMAITPGQAVVFYDGATVIGGGRITGKGS